MAGLSAMVLESAAEQTFPGTAGNAGRARHQARSLVAAVAAADALTISSAVALASTWQSRVPLWPEALSPRETLATHPGPWMVLSWVLALAVQGGYSRPFLGTCADELRRVLIGSMLTAGSTGLFCYLVQPQLSRGFVLLGFAVGTPLLLAERCAGRRILHALRARGHLLRKAVAVGSPAGVVELVAALERARYAGYDVVGACVPGDVTLRPGSLPVPVLG